MFLIFTISPLFCRSISNRRKTFFFFFFFLFFRHLRELRENALVMALRNVKSMRSIWQNLDHISPLLLLFINTFFLPQKNSISALMRFFLFFPLLISISFITLRMNVHMCVENQILHTSVNKRERLNHQKKCKENSITGI